MQDRKTVKHKRDSRGRVIMPPKNRKPKTVNFRFISVATSILILALAATGALLHFSIQNNAANSARLYDIERSIVRVTQIEDSNERDQAIEELGKKINFVKRRPDIAKSLVIFLPS